MSIVRRAPVLFAIVVAALGAAVARADLAALYRGGDLGALRRAGAATDEVERGLRAADRATVLGAVVAAEAAPDGWELLEPLATVAAGWDRSTAAPAARAAARIARTLDGDAAILLDIPDQRLEAIGHAWQALTDRGDRWSDVRVHALEVAAHVARARGATADLVADETVVLMAAATATDPQLRRAALELLPVPAPDALRPLLAARVVADADPLVRLAAAQALCAAVPDDDAAVLAALGTSGLAALRAMVAVPPPDVGGALLDAARCLAADPDPRSARALAGLRHAAPRPLRAALARVAADVRARRGPADRP